MLDTTTFIGLDVHARSIKAVSLDVMTGEVRAATFGYDAGAVAEWVRSVDPRARCVYESGVTGFDLQKRLSGLGVDCVVGAVSKMIKPSADRRRKNDRNDAEFLARMLSVGNVVEVWVPDDECEAARDLTRALEDARDDLSRSKQRLSKFLLRHGLAFDERTPTGRRKGNWTRAHWSWIGLATLMWTVPGGAQETGGPYMRDPRHPRHFTDEFKRQIVDLYNAGKPKREIMDEYDLGKSTVERWIKSINATGSPRAADNRTPEQNRILELERENRRLRMEVDVLKQAALIYARK